MTVKELRDLLLQLDGYTEVYVKDATEIGGGAGDEYYHIYVQWGEITDDGLQLVI